MKLCDYHFHTYLSPDASNSLEEMANAAYNAGFAEICVTDHCDEGHCSDISKNGQNFDFSYNEEKSFKQYLSISREIKNKINILYGIELGEPCQNLKRAEEILSNNNFDFVIGSLHNLDNMPDFWSLDYSNYDVDKLFLRYLYELEEHIKWNGFDVLGHITYPLRYIIGEYKIDFDIKKYINDIYDLLKIIVKNNKGIEINTSGLRQSINKLLPGEEIISLYKKAGGKIITVGSDAHNTSDMGKGIIDGVKAAKKCGFEYIARFKNRNPVFEKIDI